VPDEGPALDGEARRRAPGLQLLVVVEVVEEDEEAVGFD